MTKQATMLFWVLILAIWLTGVFLYWLFVVIPEGEAAELSPHFSTQEFSCRCCGEVKVSHRLIKMLEKLRAEVGEPIIITSGYRCETHNREVRGVKYSQHLKGTAADIKVSGMTARKLYDKCTTMGFGFVKLYSGWVHVDVRQREGDYTVEYLYQTGGSV